MRTVEATRQTLAATVRNHLPDPPYILTLNGCSFKLSGLHLIAMQTPQGERVPGKHCDTVREMVTAIAGFAGRHGESI